MTMHTNGYWGLTKVNDGEDCDEITSEINGCIVNICAVFGPMHYSMGMPNGQPEPEYTVTAEEAAANGRLLREAHRMYIALETIARAQKGRVLLSANDCAEIAAAALAKVFED